MRALDASLWLYRNTLKRIRPAHSALHRLLERTLLPALEHANDFKTIPDDPFWFRLELLTRQHERETRHLLRRLAQPGMVALDVGAHVGYYTRLLAAATGANGRVIALEPHPQTQRVLQRNTAKLPTVTTLQAAAAESGGTAELFDYLLMSASGSLHYDAGLAHQQRQQMGAGDLAPRQEANFEMRRYQVQTVALDDCLRRLDIPQVDLVKMDIEGAELAALRGMRRTIAASPRLMLVMEYNPAALAAFGQAPAAALEEALALGFTRVQAIEAGGALMDWGDAALVSRETARLQAEMGVVNLLLTR